MSFRYIDNTLAIQHGTLADPQNHQVTVKVDAFGINRADILQRAGHYPPPPGESDILGLEVSGTVAAIGSRVTEWEVGEKVFGLVAGGGYANLVNVDQRHLLRVPEGMAMNHAAGLAEVFLTAFQALKLLANVQAKQKVLVHPGASGVGLACIQLARYFNCDVAVTVSNVKKQRKCQSLGATHCINYQQQDFVDVIKREWGGVDVVVDMVGGEYLNRNLSALNRDGKIINLAMLGGRYSKELDIAALLQKRASILGSTLRNRDDEYKAQLVAKFNRDVMLGFSEGQLEVPVDSEFPVSDVPLAHQRMSQNDTIGKLVCYWT